MNAISLRLTAAGLVAALSATVVGCYYPGYPPSNNYSAYNGDSKDGYAGAPEETPLQSDAPAQQYPHYAGVDPGLAIAGVAAAGLIGYGLGGHYGYYGPYYGPRYYRPVYYSRGYYGRPYYGHRYYGRAYSRGYSRPPRYSHH